MIGILVRDVHMQRDENARRAQCEARLPPEAKFREVISATSSIVSRKPSLGPFASIEAARKDINGTEMSLLEFAQSHIPQILATAGLVAYALKRNKLTTGGIFVGIFVATIHMLHPWPAFFWLLILFFLFGTVVTKVRQQP